MITHNGRPLIGENFGPWKTRMTSVLSALGLKGYTTINFKEANVPEDKKSQIIKENDIARSILLNNIEDSIFPLIPETDSAYELMENLKSIYEKDKETSLQEWMIKLKKLKAKNNEDLLTVINNMMSIFKQMENAEVSITEQKKVNYMLGCMSKELKIIFISGNTDTAEKLYNDIKLKYKLLYHVWNNNKNFENRNERNNDDNMDIDLIDNILNLNKNKNFSKNKTFCHICRKKNHNTDECYFNGKNKNNNSKKKIANSTNAVVIIIKIIKTIEKIIILIILIKRKKMLFIQIQTMMVNIIYLLTIFLTMITIKIIITSHGYTILEHQYTSQMTKIYYKILLKKQQL